MTSNHHDLIWATRATMDKRAAKPRGQANPIKLFSVRIVARLHEAGIASNRRSACYGEYVPGSCTHSQSLFEAGGVTIWS